MIFSASKGMYQKVLLGEKTLTTRVRLPAHIAVGKEWAIVPKRAAPAWWFDDFEGKWQVIANTGRLITLKYGVAACDLARSEGNAKLRRFGAIQARICIDAYWQTELNTMTEQEARDEGVASVEEYACLWDSINDRKGLRWRDNPLVWRIRFSLPEDVAAAVARIGRKLVWAAAENGVK